MPRTNEIAQQIAAASAGGALSVPLTRSCCCSGVPELCSLGGSYRMKINERLRRICFALFAIVFVVYSAVSLTRGGGFASNAVLAAVAVPPVVFYFCGVRWCRHVIGALSIVFLSFHCLAPLALHEVDRTPVFWLVWPTVLIIFAVTAITAFARIENANRA